MEKIQSAIAKARAARAAQGGDLEKKPQSTAARVEQSNSAPEVMSLGDSAETVAAWNKLPQVQFSAELLQHNRVVTVGSGPDAVAFDVLRTRFLQQMQKHGWRRIAITSPTMSCGKSTIAANLAFSLARQADLRVILAELDLRRPSLAKMLGIKGQHSLGDVLCGDAEFSENAVRYGANLAIATAHASRRNAAEILQSRRAAAILDKLSSLYDASVEVYDLPPMLGSDDVMSFASKVDCVVLVAAAETTTIEEINICERDLAQQTNVLGVVLNKCRYVEEGYGY